MKSHGAARACACAVPGLSLAERHGSDEDAEQTAALRTHDSHEEPRVLEWEPAETRHTGSSAVAAGIGQPTEMASSRRAPNRAACGACRLDVRRVCAAARGGGAAAPGG